MNTPKNLSARTSGIALALAVAAPLGVNAGPAGAVPPPSGTAHAAKAHAIPAQRANTAHPAHSAHPAHKAKPTHRAKPAHRVSFGERTIKVAAHYQGTPYRSGGTTPRGFDCSGFTRFVFAKLHKRIPRSSQQQFNGADRVRQPRVGDLIFYHYGRGGSVYHVAIYAGHGKVWHSTRPGERVRKTTIHASSWTAGRY